MTVPTSPRLGFIGLGLMGGPMAMNMLAAGTPLTVWNRSSGATNLAAEKGAQVAASPAEVASQSDIVFSCLFNASVAEEVLFGPNGVAESAKEGSIFVDLSTLDPQTTKELAARLLATCGMRWVDAPISGGVSGAKDGTLIILAGGDEADVAAVRAVAGPMCARVEYLGELGFGQFGKLCNQMLVGCNRLVVAEMVLLSDKMGFDSTRLPDILNGALGDSQILQKDGPFMINRDYQPRGRCQNMIKDMNSIMSLARSLNTGLPFTGLAQEIWRLHAGHGYLQEDGASVMDFYDPPEGKDKA